MQPVGKYVVELLKLLYHRWYYEPDQQADDKAYEDKRDDDGQGPHAYVKLVLNKLDYGVEQVGKKPCHKKRDEHFAEVLDKQDGGND